MRAESVTLSTPQSPNKVYLKVNPEPFRGMPMGLGGLILRRRIHTGRGTKFHQDPTIGAVTINSSILRDPY